IYGQWPVSMRFNTPNYKIWVGNFTNRLEADRALVRIKRNYMNAFIFQPKDD
ncbi:MAG: SPOR domain-containing protein, partial [Bacteroidia bacterium]|nr:SPOR domain-containing protein [Bacteroidia bacterium]